MVHRAIVIPPRLVPCARAAVELGLEAWLAASELGMQRVPHQAVIAVPLARTINGEHEAVARQRLEDARRAVSVQQRVAQRTVSVSSTLVRTTKARAPSSTSHSTSSRT